MASLQNLLVCVLCACADSLTLHKVIAVSRHSVRVGEGGQPGMSRDGRNWFTDYEKDWGAQGPGNLTVHGKAAAKERGKWWRQLYVETGIVQDARNITVYADGSDPTNREKVTGEGFLSGFLPASEVHMHLEPVFSKNMFGHGATRNASDYRCGVPGKATVDGLIGGSMSRIHTIIDPAMEKATAQYDCCSDTICEQYGGTDTPCTFTNIPEVWNSGMGFYVGSWVTGLMATDYVSMMYVNNMSWDQVAQNTGSFVDWMQEVERPISNVFHTYVSSDQYCRAYGSQFLRHIGDTMLQITYGEETYGLDSKAADSMVLYFAHGENIGYLTRLLQFQWVFEMWGAMNVPPVCMLVFEILKEGEMFYVKAYVETQQPEQIRNLEELSPESPPDRVFVSIPDCSHGPEASCPVKDFVSIIYDAILSTCTMPYKEGDEPTPAPTSAPTPVPSETSECSSKTGLIVAVAVLAFLVCCLLTAMFYYYKRFASGSVDKAEYIESVAVN